MIRYALALFLALHGLVHLWYLTLSLRLVAFRPEMGWTGQSWLLSPVLPEAPLRGLAATLFALLAVAFVGAGTMLALDVAAWRPLTAVATIASSIVLLLFWDGQLEMTVEKGLVGLLVNVGVLIALAVFE